MELSFGIDVRDIDAFMTGELIRAYVSEEYLDIKLPMTASLIEVEIKCAKTTEESRNGVFRIRKRVSD